MRATISVAMAGESHGWVIAVIPSPDRLVMGTTLVVGSVRGNNGWDSEPGGTVEFKAWLWPQPGGAIRLGTHADAVTAATPDALRVKLQKHADGDGHLVGARGACLVSGGALAWVVGVALAVTIAGVAVLLLGLSMPPEDKR